MKIKRKLASGAVAASLGIALIGGGTWAAFNDIENVNASVAAGTLDLVLSEVDGPINFNISNLKPGDSMTRFIELDTGSDSTLAIKEVLLSINSVNFDDYVPEEGDPDIFGANSVEEYLDQFKVTLLRTGTEGTVEDIIIGGSDGITLADIYKATNLNSPDSTAASELESMIGDHWTDGRINIASTANNQWDGVTVNPDDFDVVELSIEFVNTDNSDANGVQAQNIFQGDSADVTFTLEATQWDGQDVSDEEGYIESNEEANNGEY